jgi:hypothetical protein
MPESPLQEASLKQGCYSPCVVMFVNDYEIWVCGRPTGLVGSKYGEKKGRSFGPNSRPDDEMFY